MGDEKALDYLAAHHYNHGPLWNRNDFVMCCLMSGYTAKEAQEVWDRAEAAP